MNGAGGGNAPDRPTLQRSLTNAVLCAGEMVETARGDGCDLADRPGATPQRMAHALVLAQQLEQSPASIIGAESLEPIER